MSLLLNIDTATENATISIAENGHILKSLANTIQKDHASFLQPAIQKLLKESHLSIKQLNAVAVTAGPGSYTGLRVGMASAKGLCYALKIPLITISTLEVMAFSVIENTPDQSSYLYWPMIDAGRMEVFTALFDEKLAEISPPSALILQAGSFNDFLQSSKIVFFGSGADKFKQLAIHSNLIYTNTGNALPALALLAQKRFQQNLFADIMHAEPGYLKQFYTVDKLKTL